MSGIVDTYGMKTFPKTFPKPLKMGKMGFKR